MAINKDKKQEIVKELAEDLKQQRSLVFVSINGLKVKNLSALRRKIKESGGKLKVAKKTLMKIVFEKAGFKLPKNLEGEIALVFGLKDEMSPIKSVYHFSKENEAMKILAGLFEGKIIGKEEILAIALLPSREELMAKLVGSIASPLSGLANVLQGNIRGLVRILSSIKGQ